MMNTTKTLLNTVKRKKESNNTEQHAFKKSSAQQATNNKHGMTHKTSYGDSRRLTFLFSKR